MKIEIEIQEFKPEQIIEPLVRVAITASKDDHERVLISLLREAQTQLFKIHKEKRDKLLKVALEKEF